MYSVSYERLRMAIEEQPAAGQRFLAEIKKRRECFVAQLVLHKKFTHQSRSGSPTSGDRSPGNDISFQHHRSLPSFTYLTNLLIDYDCRTLLRYSRTPLTAVIPCYPTLPSPLSLPVVGGAAMVHDIDSMEDILSGMDSGNNERSPVLSQNSKERRLRRASSPGVGLGMRRASSSQNLLSAVSPSPPNRGSPLTLPSHSNRSSPASPMLQKADRSSSDVMDDIPPPRGVADRYPGMTSNSSTPMRHLSEKATSDSSSDPSAGPSSLSSLGRMFSADAVVEQLMTDRGLNNNLPKSSQLRSGQGQSPGQGLGPGPGPGQGPTSDILGSMLDDRNTTAFPNPPQDPKPQAITRPPRERTKKRDSPLPMILERRGSFKIRTNEMGIPLSSANTPQRSRAGSFDGGNGNDVSLLLQRSNLLLLEEEDEDSGSPTVSCREAQPLPYESVGVTGPLHASANAPEQGLLFVPKETYNGGISLAPMAPRPRSARIDTYPPGCLPPPREKRSSHRSAPLVHFASSQKSTSSSQKETAYQPSNHHYHETQRPYVDAKEPVSYRRPGVGGNNCVDNDRDNDCDCDECDGCSACCLSSSQRNRRRRLLEKHHQNHHIHYNPQIWVDGIVRDTLESDQIVPKNNYLTQLFPMVKMNPQGKHLPPIVVDDNMASLKKDHIIHPYGHLKILWDTFIGLLIVYSITEIPMIVAFRCDSSPFILTHPTAASILYPSTNIPPPLHTHTACLNTLPKHTAYTQIAGKFCLWIQSANIRLGGGHIFFH